MPQENLINIRSEIYNRRWRRQFVWRPVRCHLSHRRLWLQWAYVGHSRYIIGQTVWITPQEYTLLCLSA